VLGDDVSCIHELSIDLSDIVSGSVQNTPYFLTGTGENHFEGATGLMSCGVDDIGDIIDRAAKLDSNKDASNQHGKRAERHEGVPAETGVEVCAKGGIILNGFGSAVVARHEMLLGAKRVLVIEDYLAT
jgi:hypothetical protein